MCICRGCKMILCYIVILNLFILPINNLKMSFFEREARLSWETSTASASLDMESDSEIPLTFTTERQKTNLTSSTKLKPQPIMLTITPNVSIFKGNDNISCKVSGTNLPKLQPYRLVWYEQDEGDYNTEIGEMYNSTTAVLNKKCIQKCRGKMVFCALNFNYYSSEHHWSIQTNYVFIDNSAAAIVNDTTTRRAVNSIDGQSRNLSGKSQLKIASATGVTGFLILVILCSLLYRRLHRKPIRPPPMSEEPSRVSQENIYTYISIQSIPYYEARAMVAANIKLNNMESSNVPPPLPERS